MTALEICEYQANACAAAFLMPAKLVEQKVKPYVIGKLYLKCHYDYVLVPGLADEFNVSPTAMAYRLMNLGLAV